MTAYKPGNNIFYRLEDTWYSGIVRSTGGSQVLVQPTDDRLDGWPFFVTSADVVLIPRGLLVGDSLEELLRAYQRYTQNPQPHSLPLESFASRQGKKPSAQA